MAEETKTNTAPQPDTQAGTPAAEAETAPVSDKKEKEEKPSKADKKADKKLAEMQAKLDAAEQEAAQAKETLLRTAAEYDNFRKRSTREKDSAFSDGVSFTVNALLPVIDTLEMAAKAPTEDENYKKGVLMTLDKCAAALQKIGVEEIAAEGEAFDPTVHNAVMQQAVEDKESGTVTMVLQKGYKMKDKIVRHASVAVAE